MSIKDLLHYTESATIIIINIITILNFISPFKKKS